MNLNPTIRNFIIIILIIPIIFLSCNKEEVEAPNQNSSSTSNGGATGASQCNVNTNIFGKLYSQYKDTTGAANINSTPPNPSLPHFFTINDTTRNTLISYGGTSAYNPSELLHYKITDYQLSKSFSTGEWYLQNQGSFYVRKKLDCKFYVPVTSDGYRINHFEMTTVAYNEGVVSNHIEFVDMIDSVLIIDMYGDAIGSGNDDVYERDSVMYYLVD